MKKTYLIKETQINLKTGETNVFYQGKDGYVKKDKQFCIGWTKKVYPESYLLREYKYWDKAFGYEYINVFNYFTNKRVWFCHIDIIEVVNE